MLVNARLLDDLGGMDEDFFLYYEEVALCRSARDQGWRVEYDPSVAVIHLRPLQNRTISPKMRVITRHSKLLYFRKHLPRWQFLGLSWIVSAEATVRGSWARLRERAEERRGVANDRARCARAFRAGSEPRGRDVLTLAESATAAAVPWSARRRFRGPVRQGSDRRARPRGRSSNRERTDPRVVDSAWSSASAS